MTRSFTFALLLLVCFALLVGPIAAQDAPVPEPVGLRPDAPQYALHGPYWVGTQTLEMYPGTEDAVRFTVWYPALNPDGLSESATYTMSENHVMRTDYGISPDEPFTVLGHALEGAVPDPSGAPYPLVINSHAFTAQMWQMYVGEHLTSYGFVVIAPEHAHDSWDNVYADTVTRIREVGEVIDYADALTAPDGAFAGLIDTNLVAVGGHSAGGSATYGAAGAPVIWSTTRLFCADFPEDPSCADLDAQFTQVNEMLGTNASEDESLTIIDASRVDAIFPMAGTVDLYGQQGLAELTVPMMTLYGSADPAVTWMSPAYENVSSAQKAEVVFASGAHGVFYNPCEVFPYLVDYGLFWACADEVWDMHRAQDLINHFTTAFLLSTLKGDADATAALSLDAVAFPGIEYQAEGF